MPKITFLPSPGIAIISPIKEDKTSLVTETEPQGRIRKGKIVAMGDNDITNNGTTISAYKYGEVGDTVYFMHYYDEGGIDFTKIDNERVYFVKWADFRSRIK